MHMHKRLLKNHQKAKNSGSMRNHFASICLLLTSALLISSVIIASSVLAFGSQVEPQATASTSTLNSSITSPSGQTSQPANAKPQFNVKVAYVYVSKRKDCFTEPNPLQNQTGIFTLNAKSLYPTMIYLNFSKIPNAEIASCDAVMEVYQIQIASDKGASEIYTYVEGTNYNPAFTNLTQLSTRVSDFPQTDNTTLRGSFIFNETIGKTYMGGRTGSYGSYTSDPSSLGLWSTGQPTAVTVSVRRIGWITTNGSLTSTIASPSFELVAHAQLEMFGDSFLFNGIVPQNQMAQIDPYNPFDPIK